MLERQIRFVLVAAFVVVFSAGGVSVQSAPASQLAAKEISEIDAAKLVLEIMKMSLDGTKQTMVMWLPIELAQVGMVQQGVNAAVVDQVGHVLGPYLIAVVFSGQTGPFGGVTPLPVEEIRASIELSDADGARYQPIDEQTMNPDARSYARAIGPAMSEHFPDGREGHVIVFPGTTDAGTPIAASTTEGSFAIRVADDEFTWRLPLGSLVRPRICPVDGEELSGGWKYCPWHGAELSGATSAQTEVDAPIRSSLDGAELAVNRNTAIYEQASVSSAVLARLADGDKVTIVGRAEGKFWSVTHGELRGFVHQDKLKPHRVGEDIRPPTKLADVPPQYPSDAKEAGIQGIVILEAIIDPNGDVINLRVLRSIPALDQSAMDAVRQWKYEPTLLEGVPVPIVMTVTVNYALN